MPRLRRRPGKQGCPASTLRAVAAVSDPGERYSLPAAGAVIPARPLSVKLVARPGIPRGFAGQRPRPAGADAAKRTRLIGPGWSVIDQHVAG